MQRYKNFKVDVRVTNLSWPYKIRSAYNTMKHKFHGGRSRKAVEPKRNRNSGFVTTEPRRSEPHRNRNHRGTLETEPEKGSSRSLALSLFVSLSLSLALYRALSLYPRLYLSFYQDALSLALCRSLSLSLALSRLSVSLSPRPPILPLFDFTARIRPKYGTGRGLAKGQIKPILGAGEGRVTGQKILFGGPIFGACKRPKSPFWRLLTDWRDRTRALGCRAYGVLEAPRALGSAGLYRALGEAPRALGCRACGPV